MLWWKVFCTCPPTQRMTLHDVTFIHAPGLGICCQSRGSGAFPVQCDYIDRLDQVKRCSQSYCEKNHCRMAVKTLFKNSLVNRYSNVHEREQARNQEKSIHRSYNLFEDIKMREKDESSPSEKLNKYCMNCAPHTIAFGGQIISSAKLDENSFIPWQPQWEEVKTEFSALEQNIFTQTSLPEEKKFSDIYKHILKVKFARYRSWPRKYVKNIVAR